MDRTLAILVLTALVAVARAGPVGADSVLLRKATLDPARRARIALWWDELEAARPALSTVARELRRERERWRGTLRREGCHRARDELARLDRRVLLEKVDYFLVRDIGRALDEFDGAAAACLANRYFEFSYRLPEAEAALDRARRRAAEQLAR